MTEIASLKIRVDALEAKAAADAMNKMAPAASKAQKAVGGVTSASSALNKVLGITAGLLSAREILQAAESWTTLNNRLRLVTDSTEAFNSAQENIFRIAQETRQGLTATAELYQRIATNQKELGLTGKETADIVQTINQALVISGTSGAGAEAALVQLGQAFASGTLRGEELNAVLEQAPALAQAIAAGMGVTVGQLRALGAEGVLTADAVVQALQSQASTVEDQFATMAPTVSGALTQLDNSFIQLVGRMDESTGASANASNAISELSKILSDPRTIEAANNLAAGIATAFTAIIGAARDVVNGVQWMAEEVAVAMGGIGLHDIDRLEAEASRLQGLMDKVRGEGYGPGTAIFENLLGSFEENERRLNQAYDLMSVQTQAQATQQQNATTTETVTQKVVALSSATQKLTEDQKASIKAANDLDRAHQSNGKVIADLAESIYQASLSASELAKRQAELRLNQYATPEQIAQVNSLADALFRMEAKKAAGASFEQAMSTLPGGESPELERLRLEYEQKQLIVAEAYQTEYLNKQMHDQAMLTLDQAYAAQRQQIMDQSMAQQQAQALQSAASIISITATQISTMQGLFDQGSAAGKAFFLFSQALAAANAVVQGFQSAMAIRVAYAQMAAMSGPAAPALLAAGEIHANVAMGMGVATAALIGAQTVASFEGGGFTGTGSRSGGMDGKGGFMAMVHPNETIIDHTKGQSAGGSGVTVNVIQSSEKAGTQETKQNADGSQSVDVFVSDIYGDGPRSRALQNAFGLRRSGK